MRKWICGMILALLAVLPACALDLEDWNTDFKTAQKTAAEKKLPMYVLFTGSDWCPYCVQLEKKVLKDSSFQKFAEKNVVLLYLDFPRKKQLDAKLTAQNKKLAVKYGVRGYPTSLLLNARGETIGKVTARNARGYIRDIEQLAKKAEKTDKAKK